MKKILTVVLAVGLLFGSVNIAFAGSPAKNGTASLLVPGLGQYLNKDHETKAGRVKMAIMGAAEVGGIITTAVVGGTAGYPAIWVGIGILVGNHLWSAGDAFVNAKESPSVSMQGTGAR